jgi:hypothetical protein
MLVQVRFRALLAATGSFTDDEITELRLRLVRLDRASSHGNWTADVLRTIAERPGVRAADLAAGFGRETQPFKLDVRSGRTSSAPTRCSIRS